MSLQRYRAVRRKVRRTPEPDRETELVRILKAADVANRELYARLRKTRPNREAAELVLDACHASRRIAAELLTA